MTDPTAHPAAEKKSGPQQDEKGMYTAACIGDEQGRIWQANHISVAVMQYPQVVENQTAVVRRECSEFECDGIVQAKRQGND